MSKVYSILENTTDPLPHMESKWIAELRKFLQKIDGKIILDEPPLILSQRENDLFLMEEIVRSKKFKTWELNRIQYCRGRLQRIRRGRTR